MKEANRGESWVQGTTLANGAEDSPPTISCGCRAPSGETSGGGAYAGGRLSKRRVTILVCHDKEGRQPPGADHGGPYPAAASAPSVPSETIGNVRRHPLGIGGASLVTAALAVFFVALALIRR